MNRTFLTLKQNVGKFIGDSSNDMLSMIGGFINDRYEEILKRTNLLDVHRSDYQFTTTSGIEDYVLPQDFNKELSVVDLTNKRKFSRIDIQQHTEYNYSQLDDTGVTTGYIILEKTVRAQPTSASQIAVVSSSASDTTQTLYIKGLDTNGYEVYESITLTGTSAATSTNTYSRILLISKSAITVGNVTLTSNSAAVTNAVLSPSMLEHRVKLMRLVNIPNGTYTIEMNYLQKILPMSQDYDYPIIPCEEVLEAGAIADGWRFKRQFAKAADYDIIFEKRLANLLFDRENQPNKLQLFNVRSPRNYFDGGNVDDCRRYGVF